MVTFLSLIIAEETKWMISLLKDVDEANPRKM